MGGYMEFLTEDNKLEVEKFIMKYVEKSLFIYGNLEMNNIILRFLRNSNNDIIALYLISQKRYITFLFIDKIDKTVVEEVFKDSYNYEYEEGTLVYDDNETLSKFFVISDEKALTEIACMNLLKENNFEKDINVKLLTIEDEVLKNQYIEEYPCEFSKIDMEVLNQAIKDSKIYVYLKNGNIVSSSKICSISNRTGVVVSVFTVPKYQRKGYAKKVISHMLKDNSDMDRNISIFFNNPKAKDIYLSLGFEVKNNMRMIKRKS